MRRVISHIMRDLSNLLTELCSDPAARDADQELRRREIGTMRADNLVDEAASRTESPVAVHAMAQRRR